MNKAKLIKSKSEQTCLELHLKGISRFHRTESQSPLVLSLEQRTDNKLFRGHQCPIDGIRMH